MAIYFLRTWANEVVFVTIKFTTNYHGFVRKLMYKKMLLSLVNVCGRKEILQVIQINVEHVIRWKLK